MEITRRTDNHENKDKNIAEAKVYISSTIETQINIIVFLFFGSLDQQGSTENFCHFSRVSYRGSPTYAKFTNGIATYAIFSLCTPKREIFVFVESLEQSHLCEFGAGTLCTFEGSSFMFLLLKPIWKVDKHESEKTVKISFQWHFLGTK